MYLMSGVFALDLGPRKFRKQEFDLGDRSVWTDTPADRLKKAQVDRCIPVWDCSKTCEVTILEIFCTP